VYDILNAGLAFPYAIDPRALMLPRTRTGGCDTFEIEYLVPRIFSKWTLIYLMLNDIVLTPLSRYLKI
jgi:hypothetical protein